MLRVLSPASGVADVGDTWRTHILVTNKDGFGAFADSVTMTVTKPDLTSAPATVEQQATAGLYLITFTLDQAGRYTAVLTVTSAAFGNDVENLAIEALAGGAVLPVLAEVRAYLGDGATQWVDVDLQAALDAERAAQRAMCRIPSEYPRDLREALLRRVQRNLALRALPLAVLQGDAEGGNTILPGRDPEVRRLEAFWRKVLVG